MLCFALINSVILNLLCVWLKQLSFSLRITAKVRGYERPYERRIFITALKIRVAILLCYLPTQ